MEPLKTTNTQVLREYFDGLTGYLVITDSHAHILYASHGLETRKGFLIKEVMGKTPGQLWGGHMPEGFYKNMWETLADKKLPFIGFVENLKKDSSQSEDILHIYPILDAKGNVQYYIAVQPFFDDPEREKQFQEEFVHYLGNSDQPSGHFIHRLWQWLSGNEKHQDHIENDLIQTVNQWNSLDISSMVEKIFISEKDQRQIDDEKLVEHAQLDQQFYGDLYQKYKQKILNYFFYHLSGDWVLAEDLMEETFSRSLLQLKKFKITHSSYFSYLLASAHNILVNYYRRSKSVSLENIPNLSLEDAFPLMRKMEFALLWQRIKLLSPMEQRILVMKYKDDLSVATIAKTLKKSENAVKLMLSRARRKLRNLSL